MPLIPSSTWLLCPRPWDSAAAGPGDRISEEVVSCVAVDSVGPGWRGAQGPQVLPSLWASAQGLVINLWATAWLCAAPTNHVVTGGRTRVQVPTTLPSGDLLLFVAVVAHSGFVL